MSGLNDSIRRRLAALARDRHARIDQFTKNRPIVWQPEQVANPESLGMPFSDAGAWDLIASRLESGHPVEVIELDKPPGATGYVMKIDIEPNQPQLYVKLEMGFGKIFGRSFHYSDR